MLSEVIKQNECTTPNSEQIEKLKSLFPQYFTREGEFDLKRFSHMLKEGKVSLNKEGYELNFLGKSYARYQSATQTETFLAPHTEENAKEENQNSENLYIIGDNIDALKHLRQSYSGKIKCIYIDPPYNTGSDGFVYPDNFAFTAPKLATMLGVEEEEAERILSLKGKSSHSAWLTFMYPRLLLARDLLSQDGVIFISIDDNEQANLKLLCDEVFGEENFVAEFTRVTKKGGKSSDSVAKNHDFLLMYSKNQTFMDIIGIAHNDEGYSNKDEFFEERGYYKLNQTLDYDSLGYVKTLDYPIEINGETFYAGGSQETYNARQQGTHGRADWGWRWSKELYDFGSANGFIEVKYGGVRPRIYTKTYQNVKIENTSNGYAIVHIDRTKPLSTLEFTENIYSNDNAKKSLDSILEKGVFEYSKPTSLIEKIMNLINEKNFSILDFFSGSATTAHAVMKLNAEDGGNRKFILVQLPEPIREDKAAFSAGFKSIDEIGRERIRRAAKKIKEDTGASIDYGFKTFRLLPIEPNMLEKLESFDTHALVVGDDTVALFDNDHSTGHDAILATWLCQDGFGLNAKTESVSLEGYEAVKAEESLYLIADGLNQEAVMTLVGKLERLELNIQRVVAYAKSIPFGVLHELRTNLKQLSNASVKLVERF